MPGHTLTLKAVRNGNSAQFGVKKIFDAFLKDLDLEIKAKLSTTDQKSPWRPQGLNVYRVRITSIIRKDGRYIAQAFLVGMNGQKDEHPKKFSWLPDGPKYGVILRFSGWRELFIDYREYLTI